MKIGIKNLVKSILNFSGIEVTPDYPIPFGYKSSWYAVKSNDTQKVAKILQIKNTRSCNWESALKILLQNKDYLFVTPPINGWVLIIQKLTGINDIITENIKLLSKEFNEAQFFSTHRVTEYHSWMLAIDGKVLRAYEYIGESGENIIVEGIPTEFEKHCNLVNTLSEEAQKTDYFDRNNIFFPDEDFVMLLAENWSINPMKIDKSKNIEPGVGLIGKL